MSLNNATKRQFMRREAVYSTRGSRTGANLLGWEEPENLSSEERRDCLVAHVKQLHEAIVQLPKNSAMRKQLGARLLEINTRINAIRPAKKCPGVEHYFIDVAREQLTKFEFDRWMGKAAERLREAKGKQ